MTDKKTGKTNATPGKPARRTKTETKPVTIDLEAEKVTTRSSVPKSGASTGDAKGADKASAKPADKPVDKPVDKDAAKSAPASKTTPASNNASGKDAKAGESATKATGGAAATATKTGPAAADNKSATGFGRSGNQQKADPAKPAAADAKTPQPKSGETGKAKASFFSLLTAACLGAIVALAGAWLAWQSGLFGPADDSQQAIPNMEAQLQPLQERLAALEGRPAGVEADDIDSRIQAAISEATPPAAEPDPRIAALSEDVTSVSGELDQLSAQVKEVIEAVSSGSAGEDAGLAALSARLGDLTTRIDAVSSRIEEVAQVAESPDALAEAIGPLNQRIETLVDADSQTRVALEALGQRLEALSSSSLDQSALAAAIAPLAEQVQGLSARMSDQQANVAEQGERVAKLTERLDDGAARRTAQALAAAALKARVDQGAPFSAELDTLRSVAGQETDLAALTPFASGGVPTGDQLSESFGAVEDAILATAQPLDQSSDGTALDRLLSGAKSLVKVRPIGPVQGDDNAAIVSRIRDALQKGDLERASTEWQSLPESARRASSSWHQALAARISANSLLNETVRSFMMSTTETR